MWSVSALVSLASVVGCSSSDPALTSPEEAAGMGADANVDDVDVNVNVDAAAQADVVSPPDADGATSRGPAYDKGTAACPAADGTRRIKLVNNCASTRWFKLDGRTTPTWARPTTCPWAGASCTDLEGTTQCTAKALAKSGGVATGTVYCKADGSGGGVCACNPHYELAPGAAVELALPPGASFPSGTGWIATGCNTLGASCSLGDSAAKNSTFEWTYDAPGKGSVYYDVSAVNAWTSVSAIGMKACGGKLDPKDKFRCTGLGCRFDVGTQCPDGTPNLPGAPPGCVTCKTKLVAGKKVLDGPCGPCPNGASANQIPTGTVFNAGGLGGPEWTWSGAQDFATKFGTAQGMHALRRYACNGGVCAPSQSAANTCLGGCDLCTLTRGVSPDHPDCIKACCPDVTRTYGAATYRYDSAGCTALGVQGGTDYTAALKAACPYVYTYGYEDHSSTFLCDTGASLLVQACPDAVDFPASMP